ncbi:MAG: EF-hand domain-containing protein [Rickettsia helvetica]
MSITGKLKSVLLTYSVVISISINLLTTGSEATNGSLPPPPPPPIEGLKNFKSPMNQSRHNSKGDQSQHNNKSHTTSSIKTPPPQSLEVSIPTGEFGKKYAELINPNAGQQNLKIEFSKNITSLIRDELTLKNLTADADKILALFSKKDDVILGEAKEKYKELIQDPYIAQFISINNQKTGDFLDNKLFEESLEEATLRLLSLEQLDAQRKQEILSKQGDILGQLKFINENSRILGAYGKTASTDISKKLPKELPKILSKQGDILGQLKFINDHSEILGAYGKTASTDISKKLPKELPKILSKQGDILGQLKFINDHSEILGGHSKAILKDTLKKLSTKLDKISSKQLVGFILDENKINTNLKNVPFSKKEVRELIDSLNNKILEKIFLQDDGTITEQDLTRILQKYKETDLIKNLTKAIVYIDGNTSNETVNKALEKGLENTTPEQQGLILNVLTHNIRIRKVLISKIERERKQDKSQRLKERTKDDPLLDGLKKVLAQRKYINQETIEEQLARRKQETAANWNVWNRVRQNMHNPDSQNDNQNAQDENNQKWKEDNHAQDKNNNDIDKIIKANQELEQAVNAATRKSSEMSSLLKDNIIKNATTCQGYLKGVEDQLTLVRDKGKELIENSVQAFKIIPKKYQDNMDENWQNYLSLEEITKLNTLEAEIKPLKSQQNKFGKFTSKTDLSEFRTKQEELQILSERLREDVVTKQRKQLVQKYVDEMVTNVKKAVEKIEITLEDLNKKKENKHDNAESIPLISKEILVAQERLKKAEEKLEHITLKHIIAQQRKVDSSDDDSDDDWDDADADKKAIKRKKELENAQEEIKQAKKNLEDAETKDAERKQQEAEAKRQEDLKRKQEEERQQREDAEHQQRQDAEHQQRQDAERQQRETQSISKDKMQSVSKDKM